MNESDNAASELQSEPMYTSSALQDAAPWSVQPPSQGAAKKDATDESYLKTIRLDAPRQALDDLTREVLNQSQEQDAELLARLTELQYHAENSVQTVTSIEESLRHASSQIGDTQAELLHLHFQLVNEAFYETLRTKTIFLEDALRKLVQCTQEAWESCLSDRMSVSSNHIAFLRSSNEEKLTRVRSHYHDLVRAERQKQNEERVRGESRLKLLHQQTTGLLKQQHEKTCTELKETIEAERRKTQALSNAMISKQSKLKELENQCKSLASENETLRDQLEAQAGDLEDKAANAHMFITVLQRQLRVALDTANQLEADLEKRDEKIESLTKDLDTVTLERDELVSKLESTEVVLQAFREDLVTCQQDLANEKSERSLVESTLENTCKSLESSELARDEYAEDKKQLAHELAEIKETFSREKTLWTGQARDFIQRQEDLQKKLDTKAAKVKELQFGMAEYTKLQQQYRELDVKRQEAEQELARIQQGQTEQLETLQTEPSSTDLSAKHAIAWNDASGTLEEASSTVVSTSFRQRSRMSIVSYLTELNRAHQKVKMKTKYCNVNSIKAQHETTLGIEHVGEVDTPIPNDTIPALDQRAIEEGLDEKYFEETERIRILMESELRQTLTQELREEIERDFSSEMREKLEKRIRKELEMRNRIAVQRLVNTELSKLAPHESGWANTLQMHRQMIENLMLNVNRRESKLTFLSNKLENSQADCALLRTEIREKDKLLHHMTDTIEKARLQTERLLPRAAPENQLDVALVCLSDVSLLDRIRRESPETVFLRKSVSQSRVKLSEVPDSNASEFISSVHGRDESCKANGGDNEKKRRLAKSHSTIYVAARKQATEKKQIVFGHRAVKEIKQRR